MVKPDLWEPHSHAVKSSWLPPIVCRVPGVHVPWWVRAAVGSCHHLPCPVCHRDAPEVLGWQPGRAACRSSPRFPDLPGLCWRWQSYQVRTTRVISSTIIYHPGVSKKLMRQERSSDGKQFEVELTSGLRCILPRIVCVEGNRRQSHCHWLYLTLVFLPCGLSHYSHEIIFYQDRFHTSSLFCKSSYIYI